MAILVTGGVNSSQIKGKIGNNVFKRVNRQTVISAYQPIVKNPRTKAQLVVRRKFLRLTKAISSMYSEGFKRYGIKYSGTNIYSAVSKLAFNNPVFLCEGAALNHYPKDEMPDVQDTLGINTKVKDTGVLEYLTARKVGNNIYFGLSVPKSLCNIGSGENLMPLVFGSNIPYTDVIAQFIVGSVDTKYISKVLGSIADNGILINPALSEDRGDRYLITSAASGGVDPKFHYCMKADVALTAIDDVLNTNNYFIYNSEVGGIDFDTYQTEISYGSVAPFLCVGLSVCWFTENTNVDNAIFGGTVSVEGGYNSRRCVSSANYVVK